MALSVIVFWFSLLILHQFFSNHWIEFIMLHYKTEHWLNFDFFSGNSTMAFFNKSLRPVEQYWNAMMHWKNIWFAFIKFLLLLSKKVRIFLGYIYLFYVLPFCIRFTPSPICTLLSYWTFCAIISFRCFETFCDGPYVFPLCINELPHWGDFCIRVTSVKFTPHYYFVRLLFKGILCINGVDATLSFL